MKNAKHDHEKPLPDPDICRTLYLGRVVDLCECLVKNPHRCAYALHFGEDFFCRHPHARGFEKHRKS